MTRSPSSLRTYSVHVFVYPDGLRLAYLEGSHVCPADGCVHEVEASSGPAAKGAAMRQHRSRCEGQVPCLSLYQPWASALAPPPGKRRLKRNETRGHAPPRDLVGLRFVIHAALREVYVPLWMERICYAANLPPDSLPRGVALGTAVLESIRQMPEARPSDGNDRIAGDWSDGRYALLFEKHEPFPKPIPLSGRQGVFWEPRERLGL